MALSDASLMICGKEPRADIAVILALDTPPQTVDSWADELYTCTYHLPAGALVLSVKESADEASALSYFNALGTNLAPITPIEGLANLGLPAYETSDGAVVFVKDNMTLQVDASKLPDKIGPHDVSRNALAYQVATTILACWE